MEALVNNQQENLTNKYMTPQEKQQLRSEIIAFVDEKLEKIYTRQPMMMTLLEWMRFCRENNVNRLIKLGNVLARIDNVGVLKSDTIITQYAATVGTFPSSDINEYRLTQPWEEVV